jgi:hypothetical protein
MIRVRGGEESLSANALRIARASSLFCLQPYPNHLQIARLRVAAEQPVLCARQKNSYALYRLTGRWPQPNRCTIPTANPYPKQRYTHTRTMSRAKADRRVRDHTLPRLLSADGLERAASSSVCFTSCALRGQTVRAVRYGCGGTFAALGRYKYHSSSRPICDGEVLIHNHYTHNNKDAQ